MPISKKELDELLAEIERLRLENAILRQAAGIKITPEPEENQVHVSADERQALLKKTI